ncbi:LPXTG cell wall anchor domain-containing protein [Micromonospora endolithica]|uniref:LPXTG cell wall anchor domain-containing protein n=1 Tax=Micromonospora endolithica TaxID=230091 RepID=A0A3A9ZLM1_9ACTN|nr:LPXTG cell wall anchor domain-containing protein [Micromonospora endolithica]RKN49242.1 LPXTG cell wall anchor domain-containing protein [Micromonospora endolithica]TWJ23417.1 LPXTG-motif cell wall-anchored protein [Micromonospora endolithica]
MVRPLAVLAAAVLSVLPLATPALATPPTGAPAPSRSAATPSGAPAPSRSATAPGTGATITARGDLVFLSGDPWRPSAPLPVVVTNRGTVAARGWFVLRLPSGVEVTAGGDCAAVAGAPQTWRCGGGQVPAGGTRSYRLTLVSTTGEPVFGVRAWGSVAGRDTAGRTEPPAEFRINWPDRTALRLVATVGPVVDGVAVVQVRVTNSGTFDIGGYSLNVTTPSGVRVTDPDCSGSGRLNGVGCEIQRNGRLAGKATDAYQVRLAVTGGPRTVRLYLAPTNRYTNTDTSVTLRLATGTGSGGGAPTAGPATPSGTAAAELPRTGSGSIGYALAGAALVALGGGLLLFRRRLVRG